MNIGHIRRIDSLQVEEINQHAREAFEHGQPICSCPFLESSKQANQWRKHYISLGMDQDDEFIDPRVEVRA